MKFFAFDRYCTQAGSALRGIGAHGSGLVARLSIRNCFQYRPLGTLAFLSHDEIFSAPSVQAQPGSTPFRSSRVGCSLFERKAE